MSSMNFNEFDRIQRSVVALKRVDALIRLFEEKYGKPSPLTDEQLDAFETEFHYAILQRKYEIS
jgi:hypothetical protein